MATVDELEQRLLAEREARVRAEAKLEGYREAMVDAVAALAPDWTAEKRRAWDRERKKKGTDSGGIPPESGGIGVRPPPPPLDGSPLSPDPSLPSPLSSPLTPSPQPPGSGRGQLALVETPTGKRARGAPRRAEPAGDPRHQPLVDRCVEVFHELAGRVYGFGGQDAKAVKDLLALADQDPLTAREHASAEIERRWRIGLAWSWPSGEQPVQTLPALAKRWNECREARAPPGTAGPQRHVSAGSQQHDPTPGVVNDDWRP